MTPEPVRYFSKNVFPASGCRHALHLLFFVEDYHDSLGVFVGTGDSSRRVVGNGPDPIRHLVTVHWPFVIVASTVGRDVGRRSLFEGSRVEDRDFGRFQTVGFPPIVRGVARKGRAFHSDH
jgi:hypothetical protein